MMCALPVHRSKFARMSASPAATAVTIPVPDTLATPRWTTAKPAWLVTV